ncbi:MAG: azurin [Myxococcota bacterium]
MRLPAVIFLCAVFYAGCTSSKEPATEAPPETTETKPEAEAPAEAPSATPGTVVVLMGNDSMQFNTKEIRVKAGQPVTVNLVHTGKLPVESMGHNFVLLKPGVKLPAFAEKALSASATGYIPEGDEVIAHTKLVGGGESTSVTFDAPEPGTYQFLCTFPGHFGMMNGEFIVE